MSLFGDNVIFSGIIVFGHTELISQYSKWDFSPLIILSDHHLRFSLLCCVVFNTEMERERAFSLNWKPSLPRAALSQSSIATAKSTTSTRAPVSVVACQWHAAKQTVCPSLCPSSQLWENALGLYTECSAQCRSLYFTPQVWFPLRGL